MQSINDYNLYIFDCDGVVLDSNQLKIDAMENALSNFFFEKTSIDSCIDYFSKNFGLSRFHHVDVFIDNFLNVQCGSRERVRTEILKNFSDQCHDLYLKAKITPGFIDFVSSLEGSKYIASGSEQVGLIRAFEERGLINYFVDVFGSPETKKNIISRILDSEKTKNAVMFGDAISDFDAATNNGIDFIAYTPYSNVKETLTTLTTTSGYRVFNSWSDVK